MAARDDVIDAFNRQFGVVPQVVAFAPGRVNLIGEHTDYNEGFVLPIAIQQGVYAAGSCTDDGTVRAFSRQFPGQVVAFGVGEEPRGEGWELHLRAVLADLSRAGIEPGGLRLAFYGDVPLGAGLSSSAAFGVSAAMLVSALMGRGWDDKIALARLCQAAENRAGVMCGLLDQMASACCVAGKAMLLDCRDLTYEMISMDVALMAVIVGDTDVRRSLADGRYNQRRTECEQAARACGVRSLRGVSLRDLEDRGHSLPDPAYRRARHVVTENERVQQFACALRNGDMPRAGALMTQSHASLRGDFDVSCPELDAMVAAFLNAGALGARMVGAGFGGSAIAMMRPEETGRIMEATANFYEKRSGRSGNFHIVTAGSGAWTSPV